METLGDILLLFITKKAGYTATLVACGWAGAVNEKVTGAFGQELRAKNAKKVKVAKALDGQQYLLPLRKCMWV